MSDAGRQDEQPATSVLDALRSSPRPDATVTILGKGDRRERRTHAQLLRGGESAGRGLVELGIVPGDRVGVVVAPSFDAITGLIAVWAAGGVVVALPPPERVGSHREWAERSTALLTGAGGRTAVSATPLAAPVRTFDVAAVRSGSNIDLPRMSGAATAIVRPTSGTTTAPRGIVKSHASLLATIAARTAVDGHRERRLGWGPLHGRALNGDLLAPLAAGNDTVLLPTDLFSGRPLRWLEEISGERASASAAPSFAYRLVARMLAVRADLDLDLSCWRAAECSGEAVDVQTLQTFAAAARPYGFDDRALTVSYGLTETGGLTVQSRGSGLRLDVIARDALRAGTARPAVPGEPAVTVPSVGRPRPGVELRIMREGGVAGERHVGEIAARSPGMMDEYLNDPRRTAAALRGGWFHTGDLGYFAGGELHVTGRMKDVIIVRGKNYLAADIEAAAAAVPGVVAGACAAFAVTEGSTEAVVVVAEVHVDRPTDLAASVSRAVRASVGVLPRAVVLAPEDSLPRTPDGKLRRAAAREAYEAGSLPTLP